MAAPDLTSLANLKAWLGISDASKDADLTRLVTAVSMWIQTYLSRNIWSQPYSSTRDGHGGSSLSFENHPVTAVASVMINGTSIPASTGFNVPGYYFTETKLGLRGYTFSPGEGNIQLGYTAGFTSVPADLEQACLELAALRWKERDRIGHVSKAIGGETVTFLTKDMPESVATVLNQYRNVVPA